MPLPPSIAALLAGPRGINAGTFAPPQPAPIMNPMNPMQISDIMQNSPPDFGNMPPMDESMFADIDVAPQGDFMPTEESPMNAGRISTQVQEFLGAKEPDDGGWVAQALAARKTRPSDFGEAAVSTLVGGKPVSSQSIADDRFTNDFTTMAKLVDLQNDTKRLELMKSGGGTTGYVLEQLKVLYPEQWAEDPLSLIRIAQNKVSTDMTRDPVTGMIVPMAGAPEARGQIKYGETMGKQNAEIDTTAEIERQKKIGAGEITDVAKSQTGKNQVSSVVGEMRGLYNQLDELKATVNPKNTPRENLSASVRGSPVGQFVAKKVGTDEQSVRNEINMRVPLIINSIRAATGMSAKAMDSNAELQFYLKMATDPSLDISANLSALEQIEKLYGSQEQSVPQDSPIFQNNSLKVTPQELQVMSPEERALFQ